MIKPFIILCLALSFTFSLEVYAHIQVQSPTPRYFADDIKTNAPCGDGLSRSVSNVRTSYLPGQTISVTLDETVEHQGLLSVYFSTANDELNAAGCGVGKPGSCLKLTLKDNILDSKTDKGVRSISVTLPNSECEDCTLQVIQWMDDDMNGVYSPYYSCSDLRLSPNANESGTEETNVLPSPTTHSHDEETASAPKQATVDSTAGGCGFIQVRSSAPISFLFLCLFLLAVRRLQYRTKN